MTSLADIAGWFEDGKKEGADYLIVVCDTFEYSDYPVFVSRARFWKEYDEYNGKNMQRIMEVYDLHKPWSEQSSGTAWNTPPK